MSFLFLEGLITQGKNFCSIPKYMSPGPDTPMVFIQRFLPFGGGWSLAVFSICLFSYRCLMYCSPFSSFVFHGSPCNLEDLVKLLY